MISALNSPLMVSASALSKILATVSQELTAEFGPGFSYTALTRMARFAECLTDERIVETLSQGLGWSHVVELLPIKGRLARDFYAQMCRIERWDVRTLRRKIGGKLYVTDGARGCGMPPIRVTTGARISLITDHGVS